MTNANEYINLTKALLNRIGTTTFYIQEQDFVSSVTVPFFKQIAQIASDTLLLIEKNSFYNACLLSTSIVESIIQLTWLDVDIKKRSQNYLAFGLIEDLPRIENHPEEYEDTLECLKIIEAEKFLKKNPADKNPLNRKNYINHWYNIDGASGFEAMVKKLNQPYINKVYEMYSILCGFKHFQPFNIVRLFDIKEKKLFENEGQKFIASQITLYSLIEAVNIINKYQDNKIEFLDIMARTTELMKNDLRFPLTPSS